jgi:tRNA(His) guanylyltransferase
LKGTTSAEKNEMLFSKFGINYNEEPQMNRKGSVLFKKKVEKKAVDPRTGEEVTSLRNEVVVEHESIIDDNFWKANPHLLKGEDT